MRFFPLLCLSLLVCACTGTARVHGVLDGVWAEYRALRPERALAIAGDLRQDRWVAGAAGRSASPAEAQDAALRECRRRRAALRLQDPCRLYAVGDEIVWPGITPPRP